MDIDEFKREAAALMTFSGFGVVERLLENKGLFLLECAVPGISLKSYFPDNDDQAIKYHSKCYQTIAQSTDTKHPCISTYQRLVCSFG